MIRVGIVGCGMIAGAPRDGGQPIAGTHAAACREVPGVELVAACDPDEGRRAAFAAYWSVPATFADVRTMLEAVPLDVVIVASPADTHEAACLAAIEHGVRGVLCEKPFTGHADSAARVVAAARAAGTMIVVSFMRRWDTTHRALAARLDRLGPLRTIHALYTGTLRGNGTHFVDTLTWLAPGRWQDVWASGLTEADDGPIDVVLERDDGVRATLSAVREAEYFVFESQWLGTRGRARLLFGGNDIRFDQPQPHPDYPGYRYLVEAEQLPTMTLASAFTHALEGLVDALRTGATPTPDAQAHVAALSLVDSIVRRAKTTPR